ncbi:hypothetical protein ACOSQ4_016847 [Xanthoceras sorbifolium]
MTITQQKNRCGKERKKGKICDRKAAIAALSRNYLLQVNQSCDLNPATAASSHRYLLQVKQSCNLNPTGAASS